MAFKNLGIVVSCFFLCFGVTWINSYYAVIPYMATYFHLKNPVFLYETALKLFMIRRVGCKN